MRITAKIAQGSASDSAASNAGNRALFSAPRLGVSGPSAALAVLPGVTLRTPFSNLRRSLAFLGLLIVACLAALTAPFEPPSQPAATHTAAPDSEAIFAAGAGSTGLALPQPSAGAPSAAGERRAKSAYEKLPLAFVPNTGQTDARVRYFAQGAGYSFFFTDDKAVLALQKGNRGQALQMRFIGANPNAELVATERSAAKVNYLSGTEQHTNLPSYAEVVYRDLWPGIDMVFRGQGARLKYEFRVAPGARPSDIRLAYAGAQGLSVGAGGALHIATPLGTLKDAAPQSLQRLDGRRTAVKSRYALSGSSYGFSLGAYDRSRPLVIDPGLVYSTYLGPANGIAVDSSGAAYVTGQAGSADFPTTAGAFDTSFNGGLFGDVFVTKLDPTGSGLVYSTYLGGSNNDQGFGIAVDSSGAAYVTGSTESTNFPTTAGAFDTSLTGASNAFITKLSPNGSSLAYSTYLGGSSSELGYGIAVDPSGAAYVTGATSSSNFPTTAGAFDTSFNGTSAGEAFITKLNPNGSSLAYSTYLGGSGDDYGSGIAVDPSGAAYVTGYAGISRTGPTGDFPTTAGAFDRSLTGASNAFITKLNPSGSSLAYSTFLGESDAVGLGIAVDPSGAAYVTGSGFVPTTAGALDTSHGGEGEPFVTKLDPTGSSLAYSTYLGGSGDDYGSGIAVDASGAAYVVGVTVSADFPITAGAFDTGYNGSTDTFVAKLDPTGSSLAYSTYLGGPGVDFGNAIAVDPAGAAYISGYTGGPSFPTTPGAFDTTSTKSGGFVAKFDLAPNRGKISARGTVETEQGPSISFSAANDCTAAQSTPPSIVGTTAGADLEKARVTESACTDPPPTSSVGFDTQTGSATGTFGPAAPGGRNGQTGTLQWTYYDSGPTASN